MRDVDTQNSDNPSSAALCRDATIKKDARFVRVLGNQWRTRSSSRSRSPATRSGRRERRGGEFEECKLEETVGGLLGPTVSAASLRFVISRSVNVRRVNQKAWFPVSRIAARSVYSALTISHPVTKEWRQRLAFNPHPHLVPKNLCTA